MATKKPRLVLYCEPEMLEDLREWAKAEKRPVANLAVVLLSAAIEKRKKELSKEGQL